MENIDIRYKRGKIYTVRCRYDDSLIYIGSTIQPLSVRMCGHRRDKFCSLYQYVNGDWGNWYIELYEDFACNNKQLLEKREGEIQRQIGSINKQIAGRTYKEWYKDNRDKCLEYKKQHYQDNRDKCLEYNKQYKQDNRDVLSEKKRQKVTCDKCGSIFRKDGLARHQKKSQKCLNYNVTNN